MAELGLDDMAPVVPSPGRYNFSLVVELNR
jgi:hypothetical protein